MAAKSTIAKRYARAFAAMFTDPNKASLAQTELESLLRNFAAEKKFSEFLKSPAFDRAEKWSVLQDFLSKAQVSAETTKFLKVLLESDRAGLLEDVVIEFKKVIMEQLGEAEALVESAYALTESEVTTIQGNLEKTVGKKLRVIVETKPELIAGLRVNVDGKTFDGTLASHLHRMQRQLSQADA
jgi:F-type H+-transporting ATPase subunit delta